jgi:hypothetical protein
VGRAHIWVSLVGASKSRAVGRGHLGEVEGRQVACSDAIVRLPDSQLDLLDDTQFCRVPHAATWRAKAVVVYKVMLTAAIIGGLPMQSPCCMDTAAACYAHRAAAPCWAGIERSGVVMGGPCRGIVSDGWPSGRPRKLVDMRG